MTESDPKHKSEAANRMWGGRFSGGQAEIMQRINASIDFDRKLYRQDIAASKAHAAMLGKQGIISQTEQSAIQKGLEQILAEIEAGTFPFRAAYEDIHMNVEARLAELIGEPAGRLHTARSRNDQVAVDFRLWVRDAIDGTLQALTGLMEALLHKAETHAENIMPGFTHLQVAQPVTFGHHLMAYVEMLGRDQGRLRDCRERMNECPLGAAALAGTSFPIDRLHTARALEFREPTRNSMDSVSDRDFALEFLSALAILAVHLSRLAEELVLWATPQFGFVTLSDQFSTGSSIMPQKKNPDAAELVRGKSGRVFGALTGLLTTLKGLPLTYSKDMQEDKEPVFDAAETALLCVEAMWGMVADMQVHADRMKAQADRGFSTATDLADWLVQRLGIPFRKAHHITGSIVKAAEAKGVGLEALSLSDMQAVEPGITQEVFAVLGVENSVKSRVSYGGTAPAQVKQAIGEARKRLGL